MYKITTHGYRCVLNEGFTASFLPQICMRCKHIVYDNKSNQFLWNASWQKIKVYVCFHLYSIKD